MKKAKLYNSTQNKNKTTMRTSYITSTIITLSMAVFIALGVTGCKKDDDDHDHDGTGHLHVYFQNKMGSMDLMYGHSHDLDGNRAYQISTLQYYISNVRLTKDDGTDYAIDGIYEISKGSDIVELDLENIPAGHYHGVKFYVGVDSTTNHSDPTTYDASSALAPQSPSMHWNWNSGYIFMILEGEVDTTADASGTANTEFVMHLGMDNFLSDIALTSHFEVSSTAHPAVTINMDAEELIGGSIDFTSADDLSTHTMNNMPLANKLKANIANAFSVE